MKNRATGFLKQIMNVLVSVARSKSMALKSKTRAIQTRLIIFSLVRDKKVLLGPISHKLHGGQAKQKPITAELETDQSKPLLLYNNTTTAVNLPVTEELVYQMAVPEADYGLCKEEEEEEEERVEGGGEDDDNDDFKYPNLRNSLLDTDFEEGGGSVIELVKNSKEGEGEEFRLEDDIDQVAELFIRRFHQQMRMQKQNSLKRDQDMLQHCL